MKYDIVIAGGRGDPSILSLIAASRTMGLSVRFIVHDAEHEPDFRWEPLSGKMDVDGEELSANGLFIRFDVFNQALAAPTDSATDARDRALAWYTAVSSWGLVAGVRTFNAGLTQAAALKPLALIFAARRGLAIPKTVISNRRQDTKSQDGPLIVKPVGGGAYTVLAADLEGSTEWRDDLAPAPALIQEKLSYPEYRVYLVGERMLAFETYATNLDFRLDRDARTRLMGPDELDLGLTERLRGLARDMSLDFCAFDLKTRPATREVCFLEVNSSPMFSAFDVQADGELNRAILDHLSKRT